MCELKNCLKRIKWDFSYFLSLCSRTANKARAFQKCVLIYMNKHTFHMLIFCTAVLLSPTEGRNSNLLTQWLHMPDKGPFLIGLDGASISLIGRDYGITDRREIRGECWNWNKTETLDCACIVICWLTLSAGGLLHLRRKTTQVWCSSNLNARTLLRFSFESSYRQQTLDAVCI